jgi:DNA polymerase III subunit beta
MKFTCQQQSLSRALNTVCKAVTTRTTIPILKGILLEANLDNTLKLNASDLDLSIEKIINVNVVREGSIVVSSRLFTDIIKKLPCEEIEIDLEENSLKIKCHSSEFVIVGQAAEEFPNIGEIKDNKKIIIDKEIFKEMIKKTSFSASLDESKGIIVGVLIEIEKDALNMVALDGFRMAVTKEFMISEENKRIVISARILNEINKILADEEKENEINLILDEKKAVIILPDTKIVLRLLDGEFIKYKDILPKENKCKIKIARTEFLDSIERASLLAKEGKNNLIKLSIVDSKMIITSRSEEGNVREEIFLEKTGENLDIGFNSKYLLDVLKVITEDEIYLEFNSSVSPCLIKSVENDKFVYLILPVRININ